MPAAIRVTERYLEALCKCACYTTEICVKSILVKEKFCLAG